MRMYRGPRQITAGLLAAAGFLGLFLGLGLVWWLALVAALALYAAALLVIGRRRSLEEIRLPERGSDADVTAVGEALADARVRLDRAAAGSPQDDAEDIARIATNVASIRRAVMDEPGYLRPIGRFVSLCLPEIVTTVETYVELSGRATGDRAARLHDLGRRIGRFGQAVARIDAACLENDPKALETEVEDLSGQLARDWAGRAR